MAGKMSARQRGKMKKVRRVIRQRSPYLMSAREAKWMHGAALATGARELWASESGYHTSTIGYRTARGVRRGLLEGGGLPKEATGGGGSVKPFFCGSNPRNDASEQEL